MSSWGMLQDSLTPFIQTYSLKVLEIENSSFECGSTLPLISTTTQSTGILMLLCKWELMSSNKNLKFYFKRTPFIALSHTFLDKKTISDLKYLNKNSRKPHKGIQDYFIQILTFRIRISFLVFTFGNLHMFLLNFHVMIITFLK